MATRRQWVWCSLQKINYSNSRRRAQSDENVDLWLGNSEKKLTASDCRILTIHWVSEAHECLQLADYNKTRYLCFEKTGCLIDCMLLLCHVLVSE